MALRDLIKHKQNEEISAALEEEDGSFTANKQTTRG